VLPGLLGSVDLPQAPVAEAGVDQPGAPLVRAARIRLHPAGRLPLHLQARLAGRRFANARALAFRDALLRRVRRQDHNRPAASVPASGAPDRRRAPLHAVDRALVHERALALPRGRLGRAAGCGGCHTLARAHSSGAVGPNLDDLRPSFEQVRRKVQDGGGGMPSFAGKLSDAQIRDVAAFVSTR
jgi:mono/diheme cytochrome c family protein